MKKKRVKFGSEDDTEGEVKRKESFYKRNKKNIKRALVAGGVVVATVGAHYAAKRFSPAYAKRMETLPKVQLPSFLRKKEDPAKAGKVTPNSTSTNAPPINEIHEIHKEEDTNYNQRKEELVNRQKSDDPQVQRDAKVELDQLQRERTDRLREREQFKRDEAIRIKQEIETARQLAEQEKKEKKSILDRTLETSAKIAELRNDPLLGPLLEQVFKEIPKLMQSFEEKDKQDTEHALEDIEKASLELNEVGENDEKEVAKKKEKLQVAQDNLNLVNQRKERYNQITTDIQYQKDLLKKEKDKKEKEKILKNLGELQEQLKNLIENKQTVEETVEETENVQESKRATRTRTRDFGKVKGKKGKKDNFKKGKKDKFKKLKRLKRDLLVLRNF